MTTDELHAAFPVSGERPSAWPPGAHAEYARLRAESLDAERAADRIWIPYWWNDCPAVGTEAEAHATQAVDLLLRLSALLAIDAARVACGVL